MPFALPEMLHARDEESTGSGVQATALGRYGGANLEVGGSGQILGRIWSPRVEVGLCPFLAVLPGASSLPSLGLRVPSLTKDRRRLALIFTQLVGLKLCVPV